MSQEVPFPQIEYVEFNITLDMSPFTKNVTKNSSLMLAIQKDPLKALNDLKNKVYSDDYINYQNEKGWTILHYLCRNAAKIPYAHDLIEFLLNYPLTSVNLQDSEGWTALIFASRNSNIDSTTKTVEMLLQHKDIDVNLYICKKWTALMLAACNSNENSNNETVQMLLQHKNIKVNLQDRIGNSALMFTCLYSNDISTKKTIEILLQHKDINLNLYNNTKKTALMLFCTNNESNESNDRIFTTFLNHPNFNEDLHLNIDIFRYKKWSLKHFNSLLTK